MIGLPQNEDELLTLIQNAYGLGWEDCNSNIISRDPRVIAMRAAMYAERMATQSRTDDENISSADIANALAKPKCNQQRD